MAIYIESLAEALASEESVEEWIKPGLLIRGGRTVIYGKYKAGKSTLAQYVGLVLAEGTPLFSHQQFDAKECKVLYVQLENPRLVFVSRLRKSIVAYGGEAQDNFWCGTEFKWKLDTAEGQDELHRILDHYRPGVLIIDPLYKTFSGSENDTETEGVVFDALDTILPQYDTSLITVQQQRKTKVDFRGRSMDQGDDEIRGSTALAGWVDSIVGIRRMQGNRRKISFTLRHSDRDQFAAVIEFDKETGLYTFVHELE